MLIFIVARNRLGRYEELRRQFGDARDVRIILDRREGERRAPEATFLGVDRRRLERRQARPDLRILGWAVIDTDELCS